MAEIPNSPNQPGATPGSTPSGAPRGYTNPLAGTEYAQLGEEINRLKSQMDSGALSARELAQEQANLIDNHQALVAMRIREMTAADALSHKIKELTANTTPAARESAEYRTQLMELAKGLKIAQELATDLNTAAKQYVAALNKVVKASSRATKVEKEAEEQKAGISKLLAARAQGAGKALRETAGPLNDVGKIALLLSAKALPKLGAALGAVAKLAGGATTGGILLFLSAFNMLARVTMRESTTFINAYGASLGLALRQQRAFRTSIDRLGWATLDVAKVQQVGSEAMRAGAFDAFAANSMVAAGYKDLATAGTVLAERLAIASTTMTRFGVITGMSEAEVGKLLGTFATTMGAVDASSSRANAQLGATIDRFGRMNRMTGFALPNLFKLMTEISQSTLQLGIGFDVVSAQSSLAIQAITDYGEAMKASGDMALASSANVERFFRGLVRMGSAITATEVTGYDLARGLQATGNIADAILDNMERTPLERFNAQLSTMMEKTGSTSLALVSLLAKGGNEEQIRQLRGILKQAGGAEALARASTIRDPDKIKEAMAGYGPELSKSITNLATTFQVTKDPLDQLVVLAKNGIAVLSDVAYFASKIPGVNVRLGPRPSALGALAKPMPLGGSSVLTAK